MVVAVATTLAALAAGTLTAGAVVAPGEPAFGGEYVTQPFQVHGSYRPLPLACGSDSATVWYGPGSAPDSIWTYQGTARTSRPLRIDGVFEPFTGDFDGDGCEDVFWYAPGTTADRVWYHDGDGRFTSKPVTVNGRYRPVANHFDVPALTHDIHWYGPGGTRETIWLGGTDRTFTSAVAPQVAGDFRPAPIGPGWVLWYGPGAAPDAATLQVAGQTTPEISLRVRGELGGDYLPVPMAGGVLLHQPGPGDDLIIRKVRGYYGGVADFDMARGQIGGTYRIGASMLEPGAVLHAPGSAIDRHLFATPSFPT